MKYIKQLVFISIVIIFLTSCVYNKLGVYNAPDQGYLVVSLSAKTGYEYGSYSIVIQNSEGETDHIMYLQNNTFVESEKDYNDSNSNGTVIIQNLPPGEYKVVLYRLYQGGLTLLSKNKMSIPFTIKTNEITYIGEYFYDGPSRKDKFGRTISAGAKVNVNNQFARDILIAEKKRQDIKNLKIHKHIYKNKNLNLELIKHSDEMMYMMLMPL